MALWVCLAASPTHAAPEVAPPLSHLLQAAGVDAGSTGPESLRLSTRRADRQQFSLYQQVMTRPLQAPYRIGTLAHAYRQSTDSPYETLELSGAVAGLDIHRPKALVLAQTQQSLRNSMDPLAASVAWMSLARGSKKRWRPTLPNSITLPDPLRFELAMVLATMGQADQHLRRALARIPASVTPDLLRRQTLDGSFRPFNEPDYRTLLPMVEREALLIGMLDLTAAVERLQQYVTTAPQLPAVAWAMDTPMGQIVVETTGRSNTHRLKAPLLVLDVGGDDSYEFLPSEGKHRMTVLLDHGGNDRYQALTPGADPSAATLGYGILWDTQGDDQYQGTQHAQASAVFGMALLVDGGGVNQYTATSHAQAHAVGGIALLLAGPGDDQYTAQTHSQGSAGPQGVAALIEPAGNENYTLNNSPLVRPSPQLPTHNTSMGQGAGRGIRADATDGRSSAGGIGMLMDFAGNDHYAAQVFAQGTGYQEGLGILVDDDGDDQFDAAWYAMGAAAHQGAGVLLKRGSGNDSYRASHSTSMGAAHDFSVGIFVDAAGDDHYQLGDLGLGAAHDNSTALFVDAKGNDSYYVEGTGCRALGAAYLSAWGGLREDLLNLGLFMDLGGDDSYPAHCRQARNNAQWAAIRKWPELKLRSEAGAAVDGEFALPFPLQPRTQ